uniref:Uncharacterized protein n=1 Tax=Alexandrium catenella TaxID=2925 RepID=A0A7S1RFX5_ALECA|mmetsp:Transcript_55821/g.149433  ORF Transcript_55821/g.149433 Transcript_55821/m.149433 type:complete len:278 (+) Transcript_55821:103-936(+)
MQGNNADPELTGLLVQDAVTVQGQPPKVREQFVKKAIVIVCLQAVVALGIASPMLFKWTGALHAIFSPCKTAIRVIDVLCIMVLAVQFCHNNYAGGRMELGRRKYMKMMQSTPWNYLFLLVYAVLSGLFMGFCSWLVTPRTAIILGVAGLSAAGALSAFAIFTERDFSTVNMTRFLMALILCTIVTFSFHLPKAVERAVDWAWAVFFLSFLVQHTQLIFGTARPREQSLQYTIDMYAYASYVLYCIYINSYVCLLRALQVAPWSDALAAGLCPSGKE